MRLPSTRVTVASNKEFYLYVNDLLDVRIGYVDDMQINFQSDSRDFVDNVPDRHREKSNFFLTL